MEKKTTSDLYSFAFFLNDPYMPLLCFFAVCEAWLTHRDHVRPRSNTVCFWIDNLKGCCNFIQKLQKSKASSITSKKISEYD